MSKINRAYVADLYGPQAIMKIRRMHKEGVNLTEIHSQMKISVSLKTFRIHMNAIGLHDQKFSHDGNTKAVEGAVF